MDVPRAGVDTGSIYQTQFSVPSFVAALDEVMAEEGVDLLLDTVCCNVSCRKACAWRDHGKQGGTCLLRLPSACGHDGDLDLFKRAGAPCVEDLNWLSFLAMRLRLINEECCEKGDLQDVLVPLSSARTGWLRKSARRAQVYG
jgi:hypothetical protein